MFLWSLAQAVWKFCTVSLFLFSQHNDTSPKWSHHQDFLSQLLLFLQLLRFLLLDVAATIYTAVCSSLSITALTGPPSSHRIWKSYKNQATLSSNLSLSHVRICKDSAATRARHSSLVVFYNVLPLKLFLGVTFMAKIFEFFRETRDSSQERASYSYASSTGNMLMSSCIILFTMSTSSVKHISVLTFAISARNDSRAVANGNMISFAW